MERIDSMFQNYKADFDKLIEYGFVKSHDKYQYNILIDNNAFELIIFVDNNSKVSVKVFDTDLGEEYVVYRINGAVGEVVGKINQQIEIELFKIRKNCFFRQIYGCRQTLAVIKHIEDYYNAKLEFLWDKFPTCAVCRRQDNQKWYILFQVISGEKLGLGTKQTFEIIDIRAEQNVIDSVANNPNLFPGYHMNKRHWITLVLDDRIEDNVVFEYIKTSFDLAK